MAAMASPLQPWRISWSTDLFMCGKTRVRVSSGARRYCAALARLPTIAELTEGPSIDDDPAEAEVLVDVGMVSDRGGSPVEGGESKPPLAEYIWGGLLGETERGTEEGLSGERPS